MKIITYLFLTFLLLCTSVSAVYWQNDIPLSDLKEAYAPDPSQFVQVNDVLVH